MKRKRSAMLILVLPLLTMQLPLQAVDTAPEQHWIQVLESTASLQQKDAACAQLKHVGTARAVPALAALLSNKDMSHSARYVLEPMPAVEAGQALVSALDRATGVQKEGILQSLAQRGEPAATDKLAQLLQDGDPPLRHAAAAAIARVNPEHAVQPLFSALQSSAAPEDRHAITDALLAAGFALLDNGKRAAAASLFERLNSEGVTTGAQAALYRGRISSADEQQAIALITTALHQANGPARQAALQMSSELKTPALTVPLVQILTSSSSPAVQVALLHALSARGDQAALPEIISSAASTDENVRYAAITALSALGNASVVDLLVQHASTGAEAVSKAAQRALVNLRGDDVTAALVQQVVRGKPDAQRIAVRALALRGDVSATPKLLEVVRSGDTSARTGATQALGRLARPSAIAAMAQLLTSMGEEVARVELATAIAKTCIRARLEQHAVDVDPIIAVYTKVDVPAKIALLPAAAAVGDERLHQHLRVALASPDQAMHSAAEKALCESPDPALVPDLLRLAQNSPDPAARIRAIRGALRLAEVSRVSASPAQHLDLLQQLLALSTRPEEKWAVLSSLGETTSTSALELAIPLLDDPAAKSEAILAVTKICSALKHTDPEAATAGLKKVLNATNEAEQRRAATAVLNEITSPTL